MNCFVQNYGKKGGKNPLQNNHAHSTQRISRWLSYIKNAVIVFKTVHLWHLHFFVVTNMVKTTLEYALFLLEVDLN